jgi:hypothetical protein
MISKPIAAQFSGALDRKSRAVVSLAESPLIFLWQGVVSFTAHKPESYQIANSSISMYSNISLILAVGAE